MKLMPLRVSKINTSSTPRDIFWVSAGRDRDGMAIDDQLVPFGLDGALETTMGGIIFKHVNLKEKE
jgi:hypothetical protein